MEAPEQLVVGEKGDFQRVVAETVVYGVPDCGKLYVIASLLKYCFQTLCLVQVVGEQEQFVAFLNVALEILAHKVKVLVEQWLQRGVELDFYLRAVAVAHLPVPCALGKGRDLVGRHQFGHLRELALRQSCLQGEALVVQFLNAALYEIYVLCDKYAVLGQERCYGNRLLSRNLWHDACLLCALP